MDLYMQQDWTSIPVFTGHSLHRSSRESLADFGNLQTSPVASAKNQQS